MRKKTCSEEQIAKILQEEQQGRDMKSIIRELGISERTFFRWKSKYGEKRFDDIKKIKTLEVENSRLKKLVGDLTLSNSILEEEIDKAYGRFRETQKGKKVEEENQFVPMLPH